MASKSSIVYGRVTHHWRSNLENILYLNDLCQSKIGQFLFALEFNILKEIIVQVIFALCFVIWAENKNISFK